MELGANFDGRSLLHKLDEVQSSMALLGVSSVLYPNNCFVNALTDTTLTVFGNIDLKDLPSAATPNRAVAQYSHSTFPSTRTSSFEQRYFAIKLAKPHITEQHPQPGPALPGLVELVRPGQARGSLAQPRLSPSPGSQARPGRAWPCRGKP